MLISVQQSVRMNQAAIAVASKPQLDEPRLFTADLGDIPADDGLDVCRVKRCRSIPMLNLWRIPICQDHYQQCCDENVPSVVWLYKHVPDSWRAVLPNEEEQARQKELHKKLKVQIAALPDWEPEVIAPTLKVQHDHALPSIKVSVIAATSKAAPSTTSDGAIAPASSVRHIDAKAEPARLVVNIAPTTVSRNTNAPVQMAQRSDGDVVSAIQNLSAVEQRELVQRLNGCNEKRLLHVQITKLR